MIIYFFIYEKKIFVPLSGDGGVGWGGALTLLFQLR